MRAEHARFGAGRDRPRLGRVGKQAAVGRVRAAVRVPPRRASASSACRRIRRARPTPADAARNSRRRTARSGWRNCPSRRGRRRSAATMRSRVRGVEPHVDRLDRDMRIDARDRLRRALRLRPADVVRAVDDLPVQVGERDDVVVDDPERPDARRRRDIAAPASRARPRRRRGRARPSACSVRVRRRRAARSGGRSARLLRSRGSCGTEFTRGPPARDSPQPIRTERDPMTAEDPIVIVGAARTPMGGFLGDFKDVTAPALGARAISAAVERAGVAAGERRRDPDGLRAAGGAGSGAGAPGLARRGPAALRPAAPRSTRCAARA